MREEFALTKEHTLRALPWLQDTLNLEGLMILSTCNRLELYAATHRKTPPDLSGALAQYLQLTGPMPLFVTRSGEEAMRHLCVVASGLTSRIPGDEQIITQVREALEMARGAGATNAYLETLGRTALTCAKRIRTQLILRDPRASSAPEAARDRLLLEAGGTLAGKKGMVIGNGQMGYRMADHLLRAGALVTMTLRQYKRGVVQFPKGVQVVLYQERYEAMTGLDFLVSATTSPHHTVTREALEEIPAPPQLLVDLAVPRDIDPELSKVPGVQLIGMDDLGEGLEGLAPEVMEAALRLVEQDLARYEKWAAYKEKLA